VTSDVERLQRRLDRERAARREAESIAEVHTRELWHANRDLDRRVAQRTLELERARANETRAAQAKSLFLANLSHEMRTPLNGVCGMLELLRESVTQEQDRSYLRTAADSAARLDRLISRLLDLVELDAGRIDLQPTPVVLDRLQSELEEAWSRPALHKGFLLSVVNFFEPNDTVLVDRYRLRQIVDELVHNVLTHATPGTLAIEMHPLAGDAIQITVEDTGPGIPESQIEQLFSNFEMQDNSTTRESEGPGLGLGLSRRMAQVMGGDVTLRATEAGGTLSTVTVRVATVHSEEVAA
jgi:signal transduction histidine kinase